MKLRKIIPASLGMLMILSVAPAAFAGSAGVTNSWSTRDIKNGYSKLDVNVYEDYHFERDAYASAWKKEHGVTVVTDNLDGGGGGKGGQKYDFCGRSGDCKPSQQGKDDSTKFAEIDVYWAGSDSYAKESGYGYKTTDVHLYETYEFSGFDKTHSVSSDFSY